MVKKTKKKPVRKTAAKKPTPAKPAAKKTLAKKSAAKPPSRKAAARSTKKAPASTLTKLERALYERMVELDELATDMGLLGAVQPAPKKRGKKN